MTTGIATFTYSDWVLRYPEFASVNPALVQLYWNEGQLYCDNTACSPVCDVNLRTTLLNMLTAHICQINAAQNGQPASPLVGRISTATEGSVTVTAEMDFPAGLPQWFQQTKYGAAFWAATSQFRTMRYVPNPGRNQDQYAPWINYPNG